MISTSLLFGEATLAHITASFNAFSGVLLVAAVIAIKKKQETLHRNLMFAAFAMSAAFLVTYLARYALEGNKGFPKEYGNVIYFYYILLASHVLLAMTVPVLAIISIVHGLRDNRSAHRRIVKITFPVWLYVSVTGIIVYFMLYWIYVPTTEAT